MENLIVVKQLPIIEEQLRTLKERWEQRAFDAESMVCTLDTVQAVKEFRAEMRKEFEEAETLRKAAKKAIMEPYDQLEEVYRECVTAPFQKADRTLSGKVIEVESDIKARCEDGLRDYFAELCAVHHLDWLAYEQTGIKVDMASAKAKTPKKLREQLSAFVAGVAESVDRINTLEDAGEIMVEYQKTLDAAKAICDVKERHRRIEEQKKFQEARAAIRAQEEEMVRRVEAPAPPVVVQKPEKNPDDIFESFTYTVFNVKRSQLWELREFMKERGIKYE